MQQLIISVFCFFVSAVAIASSCLEVFEPPVKTSIDQDKLHAWVEAHKPGLERDVARVLSDHLQVISHQEFVAALVAQARKLLARISHADDFVLVDYSDTNPVTKKTSQRSSRYVIDMIRAHLPQYKNLRVIRKRDRITAKDLAGKQLIFMDDATYSGMRLGRVIGKYVAEKKVPRSNIHVVLAYHTLNSKVFIDVPDDNFYSGKVIPTVSDIVATQDPSFQRAFKYMYYDDPRPNTSLTVFEHGVASLQASLFPPLFRGQVFDQRGHMSVEIPFINAGQYPADYR